MKLAVPKNIAWTIDQLQDASFEGYLVGGCVRDMLLNKKPNDWDITTNATPEEIISVFEKTDRRVVYENNFGTVIIINKELEKNDSSYAIEITPYRTEGKYSDGRRPDCVSFAKTIYEDLSRRDFSINAMAYDPVANILIDEYDGKKDIESKIIKTVGNPDDRFSEDILRIMRAIRFAAQLGFVMDEKTAHALGTYVPLLKKISSERIRDELIKIFESEYAANGFIAMQKVGIIDVIIPEFSPGVGCMQGGTHIYDVWTHLLESLKHATNKDYALYIKVAALFHDIGKPNTRRKSNGKGSKEWTFYGHEVVGAKMTEVILKRLVFPKELIKKVVVLIRYHMFFSDTEQITLSAVRRMVSNVGKDLIWDLMDLRTCDRIGTGVPKEKPYRLRQYHAMIEEVMRDPISVSMLKINGDIMLGEMNMQAGPKIGWILHALLEEVLEDPKLNSRKYLEKRTLELNEMDQSELLKLGKAGKEKKEKVEFSEIKKLHKKHKVN